MINRPGEFLQFYKCDENNFSNFRTGLTGLKGLGSMLKLEI